MPRFYTKLRKAATCVVYHPVPTFSVRRPWHAAYLEVHLMGIERGMYMEDRCSDRYNHAAQMEHIYSRMGLVAMMSLN